MSDLRFRDSTDKKFLYATICAFSFKKFTCFEVNNFSLKLFFSFFVQIYSITLDPDPDPNWAKIMDPDQNSIFFYPQPWLMENKIAE